MPRRDEVELFLRTFATTLLLEPRATLASAGRGSTYANVIERALADLPQDDALRKHFERVSRAASEQMADKVAAASS